MEIISLRDALNEMDNGKPFSIKAVAFDKTKRKGGNFIEARSVIKIGAKYSLVDNDLISIKRTNNSTHPIPIHTHLIVQYNNKRVII